MSSSSAPSGVTLVSYAEGAKFVRSQQLLKLCAGSHGIEKVIAWGADSLRRDPLYVQHATAFETLQNLSRMVREKRPFCMGFKPLALMSTLLANDGRWILWTDSSQWNRPTVNHSLLDAIAALEARHIDAVWGTQHCQVTGPANVVRAKGHPKNSWRPAVKGAQYYALVSQEAVDAWLPSPPNGDKRARDKAVKTFMAAPHILATNMFVRSTPANRAIAARWLAMAVANPSAFCNCNQDQAALSLLVYNERLPRVDYCGPFDSTAGGPMESQQKELHSKQQKELRVFTHALAAGAFEVREPNT